MYLVECFHVSSRIYFVPGQMEKKNIPDVTFLKYVLNISKITETLMRSVQRKPNHCYCSETGLPGGDVAWQPGTVDWTVHA